MKQYLITGITTLLILSSCGDSKKDGNALLNDKKAELEKIKNDNAKSNERIKALEAEIAKLDTSAAGSNNKVKLVSVAPVATQDFEHYIDLQGIIDADNISYISPRLGPGQVKELLVKEGDHVKKGQLLLKMDDAVQRQSYNASKQQQEGVRSQLKYAKDIYQRQKNLWDQGIGTEVQLITAKNNVDNLTEQLKAMEEQTKVAAEQLNAANIYSDVTGVADVVAVRVGETFQGMSANGPQIKIVNTSTLKATTTVPENYITRIQKGAGVKISVPDANKTISSAISFIGQSVDPTKRGFIAEAKIPSDPALKPNQLAVVRILDYAAKNAVVIPVNVVQTDEKGKYVFVLEKLSNGKSVAKKKSINIGEVYGDTVEVKTGLTTGEQLITDAYQNLYEGQLVSTL